MSKTQSLRAAMLYMAVLMGAQAVSARAGENSGPALAGRVAEFRVLPSEAINSVDQTLFHMLMSAQGTVKKVQSMDSGLIVSASLLTTIWLNPNNSMGENDTTNDENGGKEKDDSPAVAPEPPTILSLGAALVIGA